MDLTTPDLTATETQLPSNIVVPTPEQGPTVYSPSPNQGERSPDRRKGDQPGAYTGLWIVLLLAILGWSATFMQDMAKESSFQNIWTPAFVGSHGAQLVTYIASVVAAIKIKS